MSGHFLQAYRFLGSVLTMGVLLTTAGCNYTGEDATREKDFEASKTVQTAIGASGSTFINPIMTKWVGAFQQSHPSVLVNYRPIGSGAGIEELRQGLPGFVATDSPLTDEQKKGMAAVIQVPVTAGAVSVIYNLPGLTAPLRLSGATLAGIFSGSIINWQDPAIVRENPGAKLPKAAIIVVHREDGSGTTNIFTTYLSKVSSEWAAKYGHGLVVSWSTGISADGSKGVLNFVKQYPNMIGYVELSLALEKKLPMASIQNRAGAFVAPSPAGATAALLASQDALEKDPRTPIVDPPASSKDAYPISGLSFLIVPTDGADEAGRKAIKDFITYTLSAGQDAALPLNYAVIPEPIRKAGVDELQAMTSNGQPVK